MRNRSPKSKLPTWRLKYLVLRNETFHFRIAIPQDLRCVFRSREIHSSLFTSDVKSAKVRALMLGRQHLDMFAEVRRGMPDGSDEKLLRLLTERRLRALQEEYESEHRDTIEGLERKHRRELDAAVAMAREQERVRAERDLLFSLVGKGVSVSSAPVVHAGPPVAGPPTTATTPSVGEDDDAESVARKPVSFLVDKFLKEIQGKTTKAAMNKKHSTCVPMFNKLVGQKLCGDLKQSDLFSFFELICRLPPNYAKNTRVRVDDWITAARNNKGEGIAKATFDGTYKASIKVFIEWCQARFGEHNFPMHFVWKGIEYSGKRVEPENQQRAMKAAELKRLFEGEELARFAVDPREVHRFWLLVLGLFTGARVNELCSLSPRNDYVVEDGVPMLDINDRSEDPEILRTIKTKGSRRKVPVHSKLVELGFLDYVASMRKKKALRMFPQFEARNQRASGEAERWVRDFFQEIGIRDDTPGRRLVGMHAFRHTLLNKAHNEGIADMGVITGHADGAKSKVLRDYEGDLLPKVKQAILERIDFDLIFPMPVKL